MVQVTSSDIARVEKGMDVGDRQHIIDRLQATVVLPCDDRIPCEASPLVGYVGDFEPQARGHKLGRNLAQIRLLVSGRSCILSRDCKQNVS